MARKPKPKKPTGSSWVDPGNPFGVGKPGGPPALPPNAGETISTAAGMPPSQPTPPRPSFTYTPPDYSKGAPGDAAYDAGATGAKNAYDAAMGSITAQRIAAGEDYGFDTSTGKVLDNVDVSNPFSRAALMNRSFRQQDRTTMGGFGVGNRLTSGAYAAALQSNKFGQAGRSKGLEREFGQQLLGFRDSENTAASTQATTMAQLMGELLQRRMQQDAINAENARAAAEAAGREWDAKYGGQAPPAPAAPKPSAPSYIGNMVGELNLPSSYGQMVGDIIANPPKPKPKPKPKPGKKR